MYGSIQFICTMSLKQTDKFYFLINNYNCTFVSYDSYYQMTIKYLNIYDPTIKLIFNIRCYHIARSFKKTLGVSFFSSILIGLEKILKYFFCIRYSVLNNLWQERFLNKQNMQAYPYCMIQDIEVESFT